ncbi:MAG: hypothetical protein CL398_11230 [Acidiferrobacteraceae bacterium]|nr:hypothetical protein [Acidiferrobacteraceae bacterium]|tara:strand:+ start:385 stop:840 length:456 start_codon:yes stop_codon:yes gene_type:complete
MIQDDDIDLTSGFSAFESKHFSRAMQLLSPYAEKGNSEAQYSLGIMYQNGLGTIRNPVLAFRWIREAAKQKHGLSCHSLGLMYLEGDCVEKNNTKAFEYFSLAADQGLAGSIIVLAQMYDQGIGVKKDHERAKKLYQKAGIDNVSMLEQLP